MAGKRPRGAGGGVPIRGGWSKSDRGVGARQRGALEHLQGVAGEHERIGVGMRGGAR